MALQAAGSAGRLDTASSPSPEAACLTACAQAAVCASGGAQVRDATALA